jgi:hypothetical protein
MEEQKTITISVDEYSVFLSEMTRFDILKRGAYSNLRRICQC